MTKEKLEKNYKNIQRYQTLSSDEIINADTLPNLIDGVLNCRSALKSLFETFMLYLSIGNID